MARQLLARLVAAWAAARAAWAAPPGQEAPASSALSGRQARQQLLRQNAILHAVTQALPATVVVVDAQGRYRFVNQAFERQVGRAASQILGRSAADVLGEAELARRRPYMQRALAGEAVAFTLDDVGPHGGRSLALHCIPLRLDGVVDGFVGIGQDITAERREQQRLARMAERDPLTGLLNRAGFAQGAQCLQQAGQPLALLCIDLDGFKPVNDRWGHPAGDLVLQALAQRLQAAVRGVDLVARLGGDEFAVLLGGCSSLAAAEAVADALLAAARAPVAIGGGQQVQVSASIGVVLAEAAGLPLPELLAHADLQLYRAKAAGRGCRASLLLAASAQQDVGLAQQAAAHAGIAAVGSELSH